MKRMGPASVVLAVVFLTMVGTASASTLCLQLKANGAVKGPTTVGGNACKAGYEKIELPPAAELETLKKILPHTKYEEQGVGGKPTIQLSGVNVQVVNGEGKTRSTNGEGNLVIGYDEKPGTQTGSHNLILGEEQTFTSFGGIVAGRLNTISGAFASVTGGVGNTASAEESSVTGGLANKAVRRGSSVSGGALNEARTGWASVSGGENNTAAGPGPSSSISGGAGNKTEGKVAWIGGGINNLAGNGSDTEGASVSGGELNYAAGNASVSGGAQNSAKFPGDWVGGGFKNTASARFSAIFGGKELTTTTEYEAIP